MKNFHTINLDVFLTEIRYLWLMVGIVLGNVGIAFLHAYGWWPGVAYLCPLVFAAMLLGRWQEKRSVMRHFFSENPSKGKIR